MDAVLEGILVWVTAHPAWALALVFATALGESLFLFGLLVPGALLMFAFGALIGADALPLYATFVCAIVGTIIGDGASYGLGTAYRGRLHALPGLSRYPGLVTRGETFFARHGGKGIILGRLLGALRPIMPTVAGAAGMPPWRFVIIDMLAALAWALCYIVPGIVFGTSLDLAAQIGTRLVVLLLAAGAIVWGTTLAARFVLASGRIVTRRYAERLIAWSRHHRRLGLLGPALADSRQPELPALAVTATLLLVVTAACYLMLWGWQPPVYPRRFDALAFYLTQGLHTPLTDAFAGAIARLASPLIYLPFAAVVGVVLAGMGNWRAAAHWLAALTFSTLVVLTLNNLVTIPAPITFFHGVALTAPFNPLFLAGGLDLILCATIYGLTGAMLALRKPPAARPRYYSAIVAALVLIALARLYLGLNWASDVIIALAVTFVWLNMLVLCYRRQRPRAVRARPLYTALAVCAAIALAVTLLPAGPNPWQVPAARAAPARPLGDWAHSGYAALNARIIDMAGRSSAPLNVQAAGTAQGLRATLARAGWRPPPAFNVAQMLRWLDPEVPIQALPVLPRIHDGRHPAITLVHSHHGQTRSRWVLRLWRSGYVMAADGTPLWVGVTDLQRIDRRLNLVATAADQHEYARAARALADTLADTPAGSGIGHRWVRADDRARLLFWTPQADVDATVSPDPERARASVRTRAVAE